MEYQGDLRLKFTARHYFQFGAEDSLLEAASLAARESWERLRVQDRDTHFSIPSSRLDWLRLCEGTDLKDGGWRSSEKARSIVSIVRDLGLKGVCSFGVGGAYLEYNIKAEAPDLFLSCSDYTAGSVERLRNVFVECDELTCIDLEKDALPAYPETLYLLHRIETEFTNRRWKNVFRRLSDCGAVYVLMVPNNYLTLSRFLSDISQRVKGRFASRPLRFAGYVRTRDSLESLWQRDYRLMRSVPIAHYEGLLLKSRKNPSAHSGEHR